MSYRVSIVSESLVKPSEQTPSGKLTLTWLDKILPVTATDNVMLVYKHAENPAKVIREALSKALVHYYPLAGRFVVTPKGKMPWEVDVEVDCTGDGVWFVEAAANCTLEEVDYLDYPLKIAREDLVPTKDLQDHDSKFHVMMVQVTTFACGGMALYLQVSHTMVDGTGVGQIITVLSGVARGLPEPVVKPVWCRDLFPLPEQPKGQVVLPADLSTPFSFSSFNIPMSHIDRLKENVSAQLGRSCSSFDVVAATIWQNRTRAINFAPDTDVHLLAATDARRFLTDKVPELAEGYYGNCLYMQIITAPAEKVKDGELADIVKIIRDSKDNIGNNIKKMAIGELNMDPLPFVSLYESFVITDWRNIIDREDRDFGWGSPFCIQPLLSEYGRGCMLLRSNASKQPGVRILARIVKEEHLESFIQLFKLNA